MPDDDKKPKPDRWVLKLNDVVVFRGTFLEVQAEWQRRHEKIVRENADRKAARQRNWEQRGGKDDERDRF